MAEWKTLTARVTVFPAVQASIRRMLTNYIDVFGVLALIVISGSRIPRCLRLPRATIETFHKLHHSLLKD